MISFWRKVSDCEELKSDKLVRAEESDIVNVSTACSVLGDGRRVERWKVLLKKCCLGGQAIWLSESRPLPTATAHSRDKKRGRESEQVFLLLHFMEESEHLVERVAFILNADHQITDGIGIRILLGRFLALLAESLSLPHVLEKQLDWYQSVNNLSPPYVWGIYIALRLH
jgi:hypothetical protein